MVGWVILSNTWVELTEATLRARLDRVYPGEFLPHANRGPSSSKVRWPAPSS
jgi:hypothetical protein